MSRLHTIAPVTLLLTLAGTATAQPIVDGTRDALYGAPYAVQTVQTQFGDAAPPGNQSGSELNAAYARIHAGRLYLLFTGNLETNFNKFNVFIDSVAGGENTLSGVPGYDFPNNGGWNSQNWAGATFDAGFEADYHLFSRWDGGPGGFQVDFVNRQGGVNEMVPGSNGGGSPPAGLISTGLISAGSIGPNASGTALSQDLLFAINNNNAGGVTAGDGPADQAAAAAVTTGMEFSIALADLGNPGDVIRIAAMIGNADHNYLSNQVLGGLPAGTGNLGGDGAGGFTGVLAGIDFNGFEGLQYFEIVVPTPSAAALLGVGALAAIRRRRAR